MEELEAFILLAMWIIPHILVLNLVRCPNSVLTACLCTILLMGVYLLKPATSDLSKYSVYFNSGFLTENPYSVTDEGNVLVHPRDTTGTPFLQAFSNNPGFRLMAEVLHDLIPPKPFLPRFSVYKKRYITDGAILIIVLMGVVILLYTCRQVISEKRTIASILPWKRYLYWLPLTLGSVFFFVGSQNALRQFLALVFLTLALSLWFNKRFIGMMIMAVIALSFHQWAIGFVVIVIILISMHSMISAYLINSHSQMLSVGNLLSGFLVGCTGVLLIKVVVAGNADLVISYMAHNISTYSEIKQYIAMDYSNLESRTGSWVKLGLVGCTIILSELILGRTALPSSWDIRSIRVGFFGLMIPFGIYPEVLSRLMLCYFALELLLICVALLARERRVRLAGAVLFVGYSLAPNGLNILLGPEWFIHMTF